MRHTVEVTADSVFEAAVRGVKELRSRHGYEAPARDSLLDIDVDGAPAHHTVSLQHVARWLNGASATPRESMKKVALRRLLASK